MKVRMKRVILVMAFLLCGAATAGAVDSNDVKDSIAIKGVRAEEYGRVQMSWMIMTPTILNYVEYDKGKDLFVFTLPGAEQPRVFYAVGYVPVSWNDLRKYHMDFDPLLKEVPPYAAP